MRIEHLQKLDLSLSNSRIKVLIEHLSNDGKKLILAEKLNYVRSFGYAADYEERFFLLWGNQNDPFEKLGASALTKLYTVNDSLKNRRPSKQEAIAEFMRICREDLPNLKFKIRNV